MRYLFFWLAISRIRFCKYFIISKTEWTDEKQVCKNCRITSRSTMKPSSQRSSGAGVVECGFCVFFFSYFSGLLFALQFTRSDSVFEFAGIHFHYNSLICPLPMLRSILDALCVYCVRQRRRRLNFHQQIVVPETLCTHRQFPVNSNYDSVLMFSLLSMTLFAHFGCLCCVCTCNRRLFSCLSWNCVREREWQRVYSESTNENLFAQNTETENPRRFILETVSFIPTAAMWAHFNCNCVPFYFRLVFVSYFCFVGLSSVVVRLATVSARS